MLRIQTPQGGQHTVTYFGDQLLLDGNPLQLQALQPAQRLWHVTLDGQTHTVLVLGYDADSRTLTLRVNGKRTQLALTGRADALRELIGADKSAKRHLADLKAPMPGLVRSIKVTAGSNVKKGDALLVLEAMKMENVLKAATDATVSEVVAQPGTPVEKGEVLIRFA